MEKTINAVFANRAARYGDRLAVEKKRESAWHQASWRQYYENACRVGLGLETLGVVKGDRVALLSENRLEWLYADMGALGIGAVVVPIYTTLVAEEVGYIVANSGARVLIVEDADQLDKVLSFLDATPCLAHVIVMDAAAGTGHPKVMGFADLVALGENTRTGQPGRFAQLAGEVGPADLATIVYTSGTTGLPKGAMITHANIMAVIQSLDKMRPRFGYQNDQTVPFLPLSHVFERVAGHFYGMYVGLTASYAASIETFAQDVQEKRPTVMLAVPRVCEKVYQKIMAQVKEQPAWRQAVFAWGMAVGRRISELREQKAPVPALLALKYKLAYRLIFKKLAQALGGRVRWLTAAGAPSSRDIILFFNAAGIMVVEGYGMTETCAPATMSNLADYRIGTVGKPLPDVDVKIAEDGEILIKGANVFAGYWQMPEQTRQVFTAEGYLKTGDLGELADGFLTITDRKKDLIITSGGKNIAPQKIEGIFKSDPLFSHFMVIGERRRFLSALINLNPDEARRLAGKAGIAAGGLEALCTDPTFLALVDARIAEGNRHLARHETIKKYRIIAREFSQQGGELTASLKMKRTVIAEKYAGLIEAMYV